MAGISRNGRPRAAWAAALLVMGFLALAVSDRAAAAFPGANGPIYFDSNRDVGAADIYAITPGAQAQRVTTSTSSSDPAVSPDGSQIAFISADPGEPYQVFVVNADGSGRRQVTTSPPAKSQPAWSPDGSRIAYVANSFDVDGQTDTEIWSVTLNGTNPSQLTANTVADTYPAWSPDGSRIAFVRGFDVWVMNSTGGGEANLTPTIGTPCPPEGCYQGRDGEPSWSPDGSRIAYVHGFDRLDGGIPNIWTMEPDGDGKTNITQSTSVAFTTPAWSPAGDRLAATGSTSTPSGSNRDIWVMNAGGGGQSRLETDPSHDTNPDWGVPAPPGPKPRCKGQTATVVAAAPGQITIGTAGRDVIVGSARGDTIRSLGGRDLICARGGRDVVSAGNGGDTILGEGGNDRIFGQGGRDEASGGAGADKLNGDDGSDTLRGGRGNDRLTGGDGNDSLFGGPQADVLLGGAGRDLLVGGPGPDRLIGGAGLDRLRGGPGRDDEDQ